MFLQTFWVGFFSAASWNPAPSSWLQVCIYDILLIRISFTWFSWELKFYTRASVASDVYNIHLAHSWFHVDTILFLCLNKRQQAEGTFSYAFFLQKGLWDFLSLRTLWILKILEDIGRILQRSYQDPHIKSCKIRKPVEKQYVFKSLISLECTFSFVLYSLQNQNND